MSKPRHKEAHKKKPKKTTKPRTIRTDSKGYNPFTLTSPVIMTPDGEIDDAFAKQVISELWAMHDAMVANEDYYYNDGFLSIVEGYTSIEDEKKATGKKNSALRSVLDELASPIPDPSHKYNFMEMLRTNVGSKIQAYVTRFQLKEVLEDDPDRSPKKIREIYIERFGEKDAPSVNLIKKLVRAYNKTGQVDSPASPSGLLPLSACDGHFRQVDSESDAVWIFVRFMLSCGEVVLAFKKPKNRKRYSNGKVTAPTIRFDEEKHVIYYDFTLQYKRPKKRKIDECKGVLGIDYGEVHTLLMTYVGCDLTYSQPLFESHRIENIENQIKALYDEIEGLREKAALNDAQGWFDKANQLYEEAGAKRHKISKLKRQKSVLAASEAVGIALALDAGLAVEDLGWVPESHWDHSAFQTSLVELAADVGLPVVKVNPAHTSTHCSHCGEGLVDKGNRMLYCPKCERTIDRDINGSRGVGLRGLGYNKGDLQYFKYCLSSIGSRFDRRVRVDRARRYKSEAGTSQGPCSIPDVEACTIADTS